MSWIGIENKEKTGKAALQQLYRVPANTVHAGVGQTEIHLSAGPGCPADAVSFKGGVFN